MKSAFRSEVPAHQTLQPIRKEGGRGSPTTPRAHLSPREGDRVVGLGAGLCPQLCVRRNRAPHSRVLQQRWLRCCVGGFWPFCCCCGSECEVWSTCSFTSAGSSSARSCCRSLSSSTCTTMCARGSSLRCAPRPNCTTSASETSSDR